MASLESTPVASMRRNKQKQPKSTLLHLHLTCSAADLRWSQSSLVDATDSLAYALRQSSSSHLRHRYELVHQILLPALERAHHLAAPSSSDPSSALPTAATDVVTANDSEASAVDDDDNRVQSLARLMQVTVSVVLTALPLWLDAASQRYLCTLLQSAARNVSTFIPLMLSSLQANFSALASSSSSSSSAPQYARELLSSIRVLCLCLSLTSEKQKQSLAALLPLLLMALSSLTENALHIDQGHYQSSIHSSLSLALSAHPSLLSSLLHEALRSQRWKTLRSLLELDARSTQEPSPLMVSDASLRKGLFVLYETQVLSQKDADSLLIRQRCLSSMIATWSRDELDAVLPLIERLNKRQPEVAVPALAHLLSQIRCDLSAHQKSILAIALPELKHADAVRRQHSVDLVASLIQGCSDVNAALGTLEALREALSGSKGPPQAVAVRVHLYRAIAACSFAQALSQTQRALVADRAIELLMHLLAIGDKSVDVQQVAMPALKQHLLCTSSVSPKFQQFLVDSLNTASNVSSAPLLLVCFQLLDSNSFPVPSRSFLSSSSSSSAPSSQPRARVPEHVLHVVASAVIAAQDTLANLMKAAAAKAVQQKREGLLSVSLLLLVNARRSSLNISPSSSSSDSPLKAAILKSLLAALKDAGSFVNLAPLLEQSSADDEEAYRCLLSVIFAPDANVFATSSSASSSDPSLVSFAPLFHTLVRLCVHKQTVIRAMASRFMRSATRAPLCDARLAPALLSAFEFVLHLKGAESVTPSAWQHALVACINADSLSAPALASFLFLSCDTLLREEEEEHGEPPYRLKFTATLLRSVQRCDERLLQGGLVACSALMLGASGFASSSIRAQQTAARFFAALFSSYPLLAAHPTILTPLLAQLSERYLVALDAYELAVFRSPAGQLCEFKREGEYTPVVAENKNVKGRTKQDEEFARMQREIDKKKGKVDAELVAKIEAQTQLRAAIASALERAQLLLALFSALVSVNAKQVALYLFPLLLNHLAPLFHNPLLMRHVSQTHASLLQTLDAPLRSLSLPLALCVQMALKKSPKLWTEPTLLGVVNSTLQTLAQCCHKHAFSPASWLYVQPLVEAVILQSKEEESGAASSSNDNISEESTQEEEGDENGDTSQNNAEVEEANGVSAKPFARVGYKAGFMHAVSILFDITHASTLANSSSPSSSASTALSPVVPCSYPRAHLLDLLLHLLNFTTVVQERTRDALIELSSCLSFAECAPLWGDLGLLSQQLHVRLVVVAALLNAKRLKQEIKSRQAVKLFTNGQKKQPAKEEQKLDEEEGDDLGFTTLMLTLKYRILLNMHDAEESVRLEAARLFVFLEFDIDPEFWHSLLPLLSHKRHAVRSSSACALNAALESHSSPAIIDSTLTSLLQVYHAALESNQRVAAPRSSFRDPAGEPVSMWETRDGVALSLFSCSSAFSSAKANLIIFQFLLGAGLRDSHATVWEHMLQAGVRQIDLHGGTHLALVLPLITRITSPTPQQAREEQEEAAAFAGDVQRSFDRVREGAVILLGSMAQHLSSTSEQLSTIMDALLEVLSTPSLSVQVAVAQCITPLMVHELMIERVPHWIELLLERLASSSSEYGQRKGAAFGLAALVKGLKLASLKKYGILESLKAMAEDKNSSKARQGALFAYDRLFFELGAKFEPYVLSILPHLLLCFGDQNVEVREAAQECAKMVMSRLTGHGVKMVLPLVLGALQETEHKKASATAAKSSSDFAPSSSGSVAFTWRNKHEAIAMLGSLSYCAPQQLSTALPQIVPRLLEVMTDPNAKLQLASRKALKQIGSVIRNPEILALVPILLAALNDPSLHTKRALSELMSTSFVHSVDPPSLALIVPIVKKGLRGRTAPTKKMAAQVVGSMCSLIGDVKDILPYCDELLRQLKEILFDPIPEVRAVAARAMGSLYQGIISSTHTVDSFTSLLSDLLYTLSHDTTSVQRSGAAQGLAQVLAIDGVERMRTILPTLFEQSANEKPVVREGFFGLFAALPDAFERDEFAVFLPEILPHVVSGLADEIGLVREAALAAGQSLVLHYATTQTELLLPALEQGLIAEDWRIRLSSVQLLGLLLLRVAGLSGKYLLGLNMMSALNNPSGEEEDENIKDATTVTSKEQEQEIEVVMGTERRNRLFALMYLMRSDVFVAVREMAWRVWKGLVTVTPRMLNLILPTLMNRIIFDLASTSHERQAAAGIALGELVVKLGDSVLTSILPILQSRLDSDEPLTRQGVCLGLAEVLRHGRKVDMSSYEITPAIRDSLCDESSLVRSAAGKAFMVLYKQNARRTLDDIMPSFISEINAIEKKEKSVVPPATDASAAPLSPESQHVIGGLNEVLNLCGGEQVLPYLLPTLIKEPMSLYHLLVLSAISPSLGKSLTRHLVHTMLAILRSNAMAFNLDSPAQAEQRQEATQVFVLNCVTADSVQSFIECLCSVLSDDEEIALQIASCRLMSSFVSGSKVYYDSHLQLLLQSYLKLWANKDASLVNESWDLIAAVSKAIPEDRLSRHVDFIRQVLQELKLQDRNQAERNGTSFSPLLPGLGVKKGLAPLLPAFQHALLHGTADARQSAAAGLGELIAMSSEATLSPHVIKLTGPFIRILGDRFPPQVKLSILKTLHLLTQKTGKLLKPFLPQLQTTFLKAIQDTSSAVRMQAARCLALLSLHTSPARVESIMTDLLASTKEDSAHPASCAIFAAINGIFRQIGDQISEPVAEKLLQNSLESLGDNDEQVRFQCAHAIANMLLRAPSTRIIHNLKLFTSASSSSSGTLEWQLRSGQILCVAFCVRLLETRAEVTSCLSDLVSFGLLRLEDEHRGVQQNATLLASEVLISAYRLGEIESVRLVLQALAVLQSAETAAVRQYAVRSVAFFVQDQMTEFPMSILEIAIPSLLARMADLNGPVKRNAEIALFYLLSFQLGSIVAERVINAYGSKRANAATSAALASSCKKTLVRLDQAEQRVLDELVIDEQDEQEDDAAQNE